MEEPNMQRNLGNIVFSFPTFAVQRDSLEDENRLWVSNDIQNMQKPSFNTGWTHAYEHTPYI